VWPIPLKAADSEEFSNMVYTNSLVNATFGSGKNPC
jgi:hypothetical protein